MNRRVGRYRFSPPGWAVAVTGLGVLGLCRLGNWQLDRAHEKQRRLAATTATGQTAPRSMHLTRATVQAPRTPAYGKRYVVHGRYDPAHQILLAEQVENTRNGYRVWTPLRLESGMRVMIDRGWIAKPRDPTAPPPDPAAPTRDITVRGDWRRLPRPGLRLGSARRCNLAGWPRVLVYPTAATVRCQYAVPVADGLLRLHPRAAHGFRRDRNRETAGLSPRQHDAYAAQWFAMAVVAVALFIATNLRREPR